MDIEAIKQEAVDNEHLRLLELFHYISGGLSVLISSFFIIHLTFMSFMLKNADQFMPTSGKTAPIAPEQFMGIFVVIFGTVIALGISYGIAQIISGRFIKKRRHRVFSMIVAIPNILFIPYGTILAIMTLMVLDRKSIKAHYEQAK